LCEDILMKAQLKMGETIIVLIIFFFLLVFGLIFYASIKNSSDREEIKKQSDRDAVQTAERVEALPEIQCTLSGTIQYDCVDTLKLEAFRETAQSHKGFYEKMFPNTRIMVISAFPEPVRKWDVYDGVYSDNAGHNFTLPVAIRDPLENTHSFGLLVIEVHK
jgi:hypothetical protein